MKRWLLPLLALLSLACYRPRPATIPLRVLRPGDIGDIGDIGNASGVGRHRNLVVFLPGRGDLPEDFARRGLLATARGAGLDADVWAVDSHLGYFLNQSILTRLHEDVIAPARAQGYERIWLAGISMGAMGALLYMKEYPGEIAGAVLIAPYLGEKPLIAEIARSGGLSSWSPGEAGSDFAGRLRALWGFLKDTYASPAPGTPPLWLGYGTRDRYLESDRLLASLLPAGRVRTEPGGHRWGPWKKLWVDLLAAGALPRAKTP
ncbi:MAG TPA: alpha/beta hydrolase [Thermoanaerobaculia bacterium]|nr:alpha/beta hydrolase [Thermoanaerobaculia bacterium]